MSKFSEAGGLVRVSVNVAGPESDHLRLSFTPFKELQSSIKKNKIISFTGKSMELPSIMLSKMR